MAIEKMSLVSITGNLNDLDMVLNHCIESECFHIDVAANSHGVPRGFRVLDEENPYSPILKKITDLASKMSRKLKYADYSKLDIYMADELEKYVDSLDKKAAKLSARRTELTESIANYEQALQQIIHVDGLDVNFEDIFSCKHVKVRFGRLPKDNLPKLSYYDKNTFFFFPFSTEDDYHWGFYFAPQTKVAVIDDIFDSLYFERVRLPDYVNGTADEAIAHLNNTIAQEKTELAKVKKKIKKLSRKNASKLNMVYSKLKFNNDTFEMRKLVSVANDKFYMVGFVPKRHADWFIKKIDDIENISATEMPHDTDSRLEPPVKLVNNKVVKPFEQLVGMYGLPKYGGVDPTTFVAIAYTLLFGIMFGDVGQGLVVFLIGLFLDKVRKMQFGKILERIGLSATFFGFVYGSVFGFEELLDPLFGSSPVKNILPLDVFEKANFLLISAIGVGVILITISILINIILSLKKKDYEDALFSNNGVAGLVFYVSLITALALRFLMGINILNPIFIIVFLIVPVLMMFFRQPLGKICKKRKDLKPEGGIGGFIAENFFELFEYLLSYATNTMSFLRVGGFILSHAGMMLVVFALAESVSPVAKPIVIIIGNLFVMGLEGLIVGIQVLRLQYYEIFSRFFGGGGKAFKPIAVSYEIKE
ncbi:MAG: ATPase [Clostridiales bacterium]|nr:ATPase [Clostridiales bacterium]